MRVLVIGNGLSGTVAAKTMRELDQEVEIDIFAEEKYHYYPRPNLIEFLAGNMTLEKLYAFPEKWYADMRIKVHLDKPVEKILPDSEEVKIKGGKKEKYDYLLLANGGYASIPPFKGKEKRGVFTLRTLDDTYEILEYIEEHRRVAVIGGGLLGLEAARAIKSRGAEVEVVEFFTRLLPRQLDIQGASLLKEQIENMGIRVHLGLATEEILGQDGVTGLKFKGGEEIEADVALVAAGVRTNIQIASEAGLKTDRGLVVNDFLQSSNPKIFAAGDILQHRGIVYGIIPASFNQARIAAYNILGQKKTYEGTIFSNTLKVVGMDVASIGLVNPEGEGYEEIRKEKKKKAVYKKLVLQNGIIVGAIWMGTKEGVNEINRLISYKTNVERWKNSLLEDDFDFSVI